jgi:hypothetical protein
MRMVTNAVKADAGVAVGVDVAPLIAPKKPSV